MELMGNYPKEAGKEKLQKYFAVFAKPVKYDFVLPRADVFMADNREEAVKKMEGLLGQETMRKIKIEFSAKEISKGEYWTEKNLQVNAQAKEREKDDIDSKFRQWHKSLHKKNHEAQNYQSGEKGL